MSKHRTTVFLETDMLQAIRKVAKADERPMAYHYDKALRAYGPIKKLTAKAVKSKELSNSIKGLVSAHVPLGINMTAWGEWLMAKGSKLTKAAKDKQFKLLLNYSEADQQLIIDASINSGWQGLFPLKGQQKQTESFAKQHTDDEWRKNLLSDEG